MDGLIYIHLAIATLAGSGQIDTKAQIQPRLHGVTNTYVIPIVELDYRTRFSLQFIAKGAPSLSHRVVDPGLEIKTTPTGEARLDLNQIRR